MARGVIDEAIPYVLESDRDSPEEEQTIWYLKMRSSKDVNRSVTQYSAARRMGRAGYDEVDEQRYNKADLNTFLGFVEKVEQFTFGIPSPEETHIKYEEDGKGEIFETKEIVMEEGKKTTKSRKWIRVKIIEKVSELKDVWLCLSIQDMNELLAASNDYNRLSESSKKA